jgi:NaMN:DMB phosphoribosyltransferase
MADRMTDKLTILQLRKLQALQGEKRSLSDYVNAVRRVGDPEVLAVTATSAAVCATGMGR